LIWKPNLKENVAKYQRRGWHASRPNFW
jgi:hypothetical protein